MARKEGSENLSSAPAKASNRKTRWPRCRRRPARARQTTAGAAPAAPVWVPAASMVAASVRDLAAENPIGPAGITEDQRHEYGHAEQHEDLAVFGRGRLPDRDALRYDIGPHADAETGIGQRKQQQRQKERSVVLPRGEAAQQQH